MTIRVVSLNLNHRTLAKPIVPELTDELLTLVPDVIVLCEYVEGAGRAEFHAQLRSRGLTHIAVSNSENYAASRWHNQILIASREPIAPRSFGGPATDPMRTANYLAVNTFGLDLAGIRVPAYTAAADIYGYWEWLESAISGDLVIGDFNVDPRRPSKRDRVLTSLAERTGFEIVTPTESWSFRCARGTEWQIDHALVRNRAVSVGASYATDQFVPVITDHAALVVDVEVRSDAQSTC